MRGNLEKRRGGLNQRRASPGRKIRGEKGGVRREKVEKGTRAGGPVSGRGPFSCKKSVRIREKVLYGGERLPRSILK